MNSLIQTGEEVFVTVSHTWLYSDYTDMSNKTLKGEVNNATVELYVNDEYVEKLKFYTKEVNSNNYFAPDSVSGYISTYLPKAGDRIRLVAESKEYGKAEATVVMPDEVPIDDLKLTVSPIRPYYYEYDGDNMFSTNFTLDIIATFTDPKAITNYYIADFSYKYNAHFSESDDDNEDNEMYVSFNFGWIDSDVEPLFSEHISALESVFGAESYRPYFFSDMQISGASYPIRMCIRNNYFGTNLVDENANYGSSVTFKLYNISEDYYKYLVYVWQLDDGMSGMLQDVGFGDSLVGYSNVSTNAGIVAALTSTTYTVELDSALKEIIRSTIADDK